MEGIERSHGDKDKAAAEPCNPLYLWDFQRIILQGTQRYSWRRKSPKVARKKLSLDSRGAPRIRGSTESRAESGALAPPSAASLHVGPTGDTAPGQVEAVSAFAGVLKMSSPMLSATRADDALIESRARCA